MQKKISIVCIHGGPGLDDSYFHPYLDSLSDVANIYSYTLDCKPEDGIAGLVDQLERELQRFKDLSRVYLLGHSFGSLLIFEFLKRNPEKQFAGLILCSWIYNLSWYLPRPEDEKFNLITDEDYRDWFIKNAARYFSADFVATGKALAGRIRYNMALANSIMGNYFPVVDFNDDLSSIRLPTLSITGENDEIINKDYVARGAKKISNCQHKVMDGRGHFPFVEDAQGFCKLVREFVT